MSKGGQHGLKWVLLLCVPVFAVCIRYSRLTPVLRRCAGRLNARVVRKDAWEGIENHLLDDDVHLQSLPPRIADRIGDDPRSGVASRCAHENFVKAVKSQDTEAARRHFDTIAKEGDGLTTLRLRQLVETLCAKGEVLEASELVTWATETRNFKHDDLATTVSGMRVLLLITRSACRLVLTSTSGRSLGRHLHIPVASGDAFVPLVSARRTPGRYEVAANPHLGRSGIVPYRAAFLVIDQPALREAALQASRAPVCGVVTSLLRRFLMK